MGNVCKRENFKGMATPPRRTKIRVHLALGMVNAACRWIRYKFTKNRPNHQTQQVLFLQQNFPQKVPGKIHLPPTLHPTLHPQAQTLSRQLRLQKIQSLSFIFQSADLFAPLPSLNPAELLSRGARSQKYRFERLKNQTLQPIPAWYPFIFEQTLKS